MSEPISPDSPEFRTLANLRTLSTVLQQRNLFASNAGITFNGQRDLYRALGYKRQLLPSDYRARYYRNGVAARIVEAAPKSTWRAGGELVEDEDPNTLTDFEEAWDELNKRLNVWSVFQRTDILCGMGRYAIIVFGAPDEIHLELKKLRPEELMYLSPFSEEDALITRFETDIESPRFGLPLEYMLRRTNVAMATIQPPALMPGRPIHWTRVQHVADGLLDDRVYGIPRLERIWNLLDDLEKVIGGGAEAFWKRADAGMQLKLDPMLKADAKDLDAVKQQIEEYTDGLRRVLTTRGVDIMPLSSNVADFSSPVKAIMDQISASTGIPSRILTGSERGELASTQDRANWEERISDRRYDYASPQVVRPFVDRMIELGVLPKPTQYEVRWPDIRNFNDAERAAIAGQWAGINGAFGGIVVTANEIRDRILGMQPLSAQDQAPATPAPDPNVVAPDAEPQVPETPENPDQAAADAAQAAEDKRIAAADAKKMKQRAARKARMLGIKPVMLVPRELLMLLPQEPVKEPVVITPETRDDSILRDTIAALRASADRPLNLTVSVPAEPLKRKSIVRTATGFEIQEQAQEVK